MKNELNNVRFEGNTIIGDHGTIDARRASPDEAAKAKKRKRRETSEPDGEKPLRVLFLSANPCDTAMLRLGEDVRDIQEGLRRSDRLRLETRSAVRFDELAPLLIAEKPDVVHFSGHGSPDGGLLFEDSSGAPYLVEMQALAGLFALLSGRTRCVVLSACHSAEQAQAVAEHIDFVVAMRQAIEDGAAIAFAKTFYVALACGGDIPEAFRAARAQMGIVSPRAADIPCLLERRARGASAGAAS